MSSNASATHSIGSQLLDLFLFMGSGWVLYLLVILSILSIAVALERLIYFRSHHDNLELLHERLAQLLDAKELAEAKKLLQQSPSHIAKISLKGLDALPHGPSSVEEVVVGATQIERLRMERGLAFLGTLGNNAPFIGLFGTVLGIIRAFRDLALNSTAGAEAVMGGIAEALIATAVGLLVALPAVAAYNSFKLSIKKRLAFSEILVRSILAHAKSTQ